MDYSKFYLRNRSQEEIDDISNEEFAPQIVYIDYPNVRDRQVEFDYEISPDNIAVEVETERKNDKKSRKRVRGALNKISIFVLTIIIVILSTFVISDFIVDGRLMTAWGQMIDKKNVETSFYLVGLGIFDDYDTAKTRALELRRGGAGGNIVKENDKYLIIGNVFTDEEQANKVASNYEEGCVREIYIYCWKIKDKDLKNIVENNATYYTDIVDTLIRLQYEYEQGTDDVSAIKSEIAKLKSSIAVQKAYFDSKAERFADQKVVEDVSMDMNICLGLLSNIETTGQQKGDVLSDIRYYAVQIVLNARDLRLKYQ